MFKFNDFLMAAFFILIVTMSVVSLGFSMLQHNLLNANSKQYLLTVYEPNLARQVNSSAFVNNALDTSSTNNISNTTLASTSDSTAWNAEFLNAFRGVSKTKFMLNVLENFPTFVLSTIFPDAAIYSVYINIIAAFFTIVVIVLVILLIKGVI